MEHLILPPKVRGEVCAFLQVGCDSIKFEDYQMSCDDNFNYSIPSDLNENSIETLDVTRYCSEIASNPYFKKYITSRKRYTIFANSMFQ